MVAGRSNSSSWPLEVYEEYSYDDAGHLQSFAHGVAAPVGGVGEFENKWVYAAPTRFGEVPSRDQPETQGAEYEDQLWDSATSRLRQWDTF